MINWLNIKKASNIEDTDLEPYKELYKKPITEGQAKLLASFINNSSQSWFPISQALNPKLSISNMDTDENDLIKSMVFNGNRVNFGEDDNLYDNGQPWHRNTYTENGTVEEFLAPDGSVIYKRPLSHTEGFGSRDRNFREFESDIADEDNLNLMYEMDKDPDNKEKIWNDYIRKIDPNGYLEKYGFKYNPEPYMIYSNANTLNKLRTIVPYVKYIKDTDPDNYEAFVKELGYNPLDDYNNSIQDNYIQQQAKAAKRWDNSQVQLTPEEYAYYDAKQKYNADPNDIRWNMMSQAQKNLSQSSLNRVKQYNVQERIRNTPAANGTRKTPQQMQQEYNQELRRREALSRDMYKGEQKGLKNRTGITPTMVNTWSTDPRYKEVTK